MNIIPTGLIAAQRSLDRASFEVARSAVAEVGATPGAGSAASAAGLVPTTVPAEVPAEIEALPGAMLSMMVASNAVLANLQAFRRTEEAFDALLRTAEDASRG